MTGAHPSSFRRRGIVIALLVSGVLAAVTLLPACEDWYGTKAKAVSPQAGNVFFVEELRFADSGRSTFEALVRSAKVKMGRENWVWHFVPFASDQKDAFEAALKELHPALIVAANEDLFLLLDPLVHGTPVLITSERPPEDLRDEERKGGWQSPHAIVTWFALNQSKLLEMLDVINGRPIRTVSAYFPESKLGHDVQLAFDRVARDRDIALHSEFYRDYDDFRARIEPANGRTVAEAIYLPISPELFANREEVARVAQLSGRPAIFSRRDQVWKGGLLAVDPPPLEFIDQLAQYAALILHGVKPQELEIATPSRLETTVNLTAATRIGRPVPYELLVEATEIVD